MRKPKREVVSWLGKIAKLLFIFYFILFFFWTYYTRKCGKVSYGKCHILYHMMGSHDECEKIVHRLYSSCISSI